MSEYFDVDDKGTAVVDDYVDTLMGEMFWNEESIKTVVIPESVEDAIVAEAYNEYDGEEYWRHHDDLSTIFGGCSSLEKIIVRNHNLEVTSKWVDDIEILKNSVDSFYPKQLSMGIKCKLLPAISKLILSGKYDEEWFDAEHYNDWKKAWLDYLKDASQYIYDVIAVSPELLQIMIKEKFLDLEDTRKLVLMANEKGQTESTALILNYQHDNFSEEDIQKATADDLTAYFATDSYIRKFWDYEEQEDGSVIITGYKGVDSKVDVPETIGDKTVTAIGKEAFSPSCEEDMPDVIRDVRRNISAITVPDSVKSIGDKAFAGCSSLYTLSIPKGIKTGYNIIQGCNFQDFEVPDGVTELDADYFKGCKILNSVKIPASVTNIDDFTFDDCFYLEFIEVAEDNPVYSSYDGVLYNKKQTKILYFPNKKTDCDIALGMTNGSDRKIPLSSEKISGIGYPESMTEMGVDFSDSDNIYSISLPETPFDIYSDFCRCNSFSRIYGKAGSYAELNAFDIGYHELFSPYGDEEYARHKESIKTWIRGKSLQDGRYYYTENTDSTVTITNYEPDESEEFLIPNTVAGKTVTEIGYSAFYGCDKLKHIVIPNTITKIGMYAFESCTNLEKIEIPASVIAVEGGAFYNCVKLDNLIIPVGVDKIGCGTFYNCKNLKNLVLPDNISKIEYLAFKNCSDVIIHGVPDSNLVETLDYYGLNEDEDNYVEDEEPPFSFEPFNDAEIAEYEKEKREYNLHIWDYEHLEDGTIKLTGYKLKRSIVEVPDSLGDKKVSAIGDFIFSPKERVLVGSEFEKNYIEVILPESVTEIGEGAFMGSTLERIVIPKGVTKIADRTFDDCFYLTFVKLPDGLKEIGNCAFYDCDALSGLTIPNTVTKIGDGAFLSCESLRYVNIPENVTEIGEEAFNGCKISCAIIPDSVKSIGIGDGLFNGCKNLETVVLPDGMTELCGFEGCKNLKGITIPSSVTEISEGIFSDCKELVIYGKAGSYAEKYANENNIIFMDSECDTFTITDGMSRLPSFQCMKNLKSIIISDSITKIESGMFNGGSRIKCITIPESVTNIGYEAFRGCSSLESINVNENNQKYSSIDGILCDKDSKNIIYVPKGIKVPITIPDSVTEIGDAFIGWCNLESITIPESVTKIANDAFADCKNLTINGFAFTYAYDYAMERDIPFNDIGGTVKEVNADESILTSKPVILEKGTDGTAGTEGTYVLFGDWPQSLKADDVTIDMTTIYKLNGWDCLSGSDGCYYVRTHSKFFKMESIKWRILEDNYGGGKLLLAEQALTAGCYYPDCNNNRTIGDKTVYPNNYQYSQIRAYLNGLDGTSYNVQDYSGKGFINMAFSASAQASINTVEIDNSADSTTDSGNNITKAEGYICDNTKDKIFLLSEKEVTSKEYGFDEYDKEDSVRQRKNTDYSKAMGASSNDENNGWLWLRSPYYNSSNRARDVYYAGSADDRYRVDDTYGGVVPALSISF